MELHTTNNSSGIVTLKLYWSDLLWICCTVHLVVHSGIHTKDFRIGDELPQALRGVEMGYHLDPTGEGTGMGLCPSQIFLYFLFKIPYFDAF